MAKEKSLVHRAPREIEESKPLVVRRGRVDSVDLFEIKESELEMFEKGSPADSYLNISIFLISMAFTSICTLETATFQNETIKNIFLFGTIVGVIVGAILLILFFVARTPVKVVCKRIRGRLPAVDLEEDDDGGEVTTEESSNPHE